MGSGVEKHELSVSIYHWLMGDSTLQDTVVATVGHYDLVPSNIDLTAAEVALMQFDERIRNHQAIERTTSCLRLHHCRLSALTEHSDGECIGCGHWRIGAHAMRVLCTGGTVRTVGYRGGHSGQGEPQLGNRGAVANNVRRPKQPQS